MDSATSTSWPPTGPETANSASAQPAQVRSNDELMTADRSEQKYLIEPAKVQQLMRAITERVPRHFPPGAVRLPGAQQFSTTVYFDTPSRHLFHQASTNDASVKLRSREYYTLDPSMVRVARRPEQMVRFDPVMWFELKHKDGHQVKKHRFGIPKAEVPQFLSGGQITQEMVALQAPLHGDKARPALLEMAELCQYYGESFNVDCIVNYRRVAWQDDGEAVRLTLDRQVAFMTEPPDLWTRKSALIRETLGVPKGVLEHAILEVKTRGAMPTWLSTAIANAGTTLGDFSKFVAASRAVHG
jgi:VTC domain